MENAPQNTYGFEIQENSATLSQEVDQQLNAKQKPVQKKRRPVLLIAVILLVLLALPVINSLNSPEADLDKPESYVRYYDNGNVEYMVEYDSDGKEVYNASYKEDGTLSYTTEYTYWTSGALFQKKMLHNDGDTSIYYYSKEGILEKWTRENIDGILQSECYYDEKGNEVRTVYYEDSGEFQSETRYQYNSSNVLEQKRWYTSNGIVTTHYLPDGQWYLEIHMDLNEEVEFYFERNIDEYGVILSEECLDKHGNLLAKWYYAGGKKQEPIWYTDDNILHIKILAAGL